MTRLCIHSHRPSPSSNESRLCPGAHCQFAPSMVVNLTYHRALLGLQIFNVFALFSELANFVQHWAVTLAGAFASYYWAMNKAG